MNSIEDKIQQKLIYNGRQPPMEDNPQWNMTYVEKKLPKIKRGMGYFLLLIFNFDNNRSISI